MSLHCSQRGRTEEDELRRKISCLQMEMEMEIDGDAQREMGKEMSMRMWPPWTLLGDPCREAWSWFVVNQVEVAGCITIAATAASRSYHELSRAIHRPSFRSYQKLPVPPEGHTGASHHITSQARGPSGFNSIPIQTTNTTYQHNRLPTPTTSSRYRFLVPIKHRPPVLS